MTGGKGFIGSHLVKRFLQRENSVTVYDNGRRDALRYVGLNRTPRFHAIEGDVLDRAGLARALGNSQFVLHLAAIAGVSSYFKSPLKTMEVNYGGTQNILSCLARSPDLKLFLGFSTSEIYGPEAYEVREDGRTSQGNIADRRWVYAISKLASEKLGYAHFWEYGMPICYVRPFNVFGPGQVGEGVISNFVYRALHGLPLRLTGDGSQVRAFCYIDDFCDAIERCLACTDVVRGESFNIGNSSEPVAMLDLARRILELTGSSSKIEFVPHAGEDIRYRSPCTEKASRLLGYVPRHALDEGLRKTIEWFENVNPAEPA